MRPSDNPIRRALRLALSIGGFAQPDVWRKLSVTGPELPAKPRQCAECPLRRGGEWNDRVSDLSAIDGDVLRGAAKRWWCHKDERRPCAGMLLAVKDRCGDDQS